MLAVANQACSIKGALKLKVKIHSVKLERTFLVLDGMGCSCILGLYVEIYECPGDFPDTSIIFENLNEIQEKVVKEVKINWEDSMLSLADQTNIQKVINKFQPLFSDTPDYTRVPSHEIDTGGRPPVKQFYRYDTKINQKNPEWLFLSNLD